MRAVLIHQGYATMLDRENKPTVSMRWGGTWDYREGANLILLSLIDEVLWEVVDEMSVLGFNG